MTPATKLASVWRAAKPRTAAAIAPDASSEVASRLRLANWLSARKSPTMMIAAIRTRRTKRRRVSSTGECTPRVSRARCSNARWTMKATRIETPTATAAVIHGEWVSDWASSRVPRSAGMAEQPIRAVAAGGEPAAVLLDAMGTLLGFADPAPLLRAALRDRLGVAAGPDAAARAIRAEIGFSRAHLHTGRDADSLAALRRASAEAMRPQLGPASAAPADTLTDALLAALRFEAFADAAPALRALRAA